MYFALNKNKKQLIKQLKSWCRRAFWLWWPTVNFSATACFGNKGQDVMTGAAGDALWNNGAVWGKMLRHKCTEARNAVPHPWTSNNVNVKIVDHCSGCPSTIGLSREAFTQIANPVSGIINIDYHGPVTYSRIFGRPSLDYLQFYV